MRVAEVMVRTLQLSFTLKGRSSRSEYGISCVVLLALAVSVQLISLAPNAKVIAGVMAGLLLIPLTAASTRRLHDTNRSGSGLWLCLIPVVGALIVMEHLFERGSNGANRYGPPPPRPVTEPTAPPRVTRRQHLDADGNLLGYEYVDEAGQR